MWNARGTINPSPLEVQAYDLGHALQKIAAALADDCIDIQVWKSEVIKLKDK
jgi:hypothetical protein